MPTRLNKILGVTREQLDKIGVYNSTIDYDSKLHIDPALLWACKIPEFVNANEKVTKYFKDTITLLSKARIKRDTFWRAAFKRLVFGEGLNTGLGYSAKGTGGSGIGPDTALRILNTIKEIIDAGITDPAIFDLVPVIEERIGADRISDMISKILTEEFVAYTKRISKELGVQLFGNDKGEMIVFVPRSLLSDLPTVEQWEDIQVAAQYNEGVRASMNSILGKSWRQTANDLSKKELKQLLIENPDLLKQLLAQYKKRSVKSYNFNVDHLGILLWDILGWKFSDDNPLDLSAYKKVTQKNILKVAEIICTQFKKLIEHNGLVEPIYDSRGDRRPQRFPQLLLYAVADSYCRANDLDLNRETNAGSGALDFKLSRGQAKVTIEIKYSSNPKLVEGYEKQLTTYNAAEGVEDEFSIYMVMRVNDRQDAKIKYIREMVEGNTRKGIPCPGFIVIDTIIKPSASKR